MRNFLKGMIVGVVAGVAVEMFVNPMTERDKKILKRKMGNMMDSVCSYMQ